MKLSLAESLAKLPLPADEKWKEGVWDIETFKKESISLIFFAPRGTDYQTFHEQDEFYFIVQGTAELVMPNERFSCEIGDVLFVPAKVEHHFENISENFATWAVFF